MTEQVGTNKDIPILITIKDTDGVVVNINTFDEDIEVAIYQKRENIIQFFKQSDSQVETVVAANGTIKVYLDRTNTAKINTLNPLFLEVVPISVDANFEDGIRRWDAIVVQLPKVNFSAI